MWLRISHCLWSRIFHLFEAAIFRADHCMDKHMLFSHLLNPFSIRLLLRGSDNKCKTYVGRYLTLQCITLVTKKCQDNILYVLQRYLYMLKDEFNVEWVTQSRLRY